MSHDAGWGVSASTPYENVEGSSLRISIHGESRDDTHFVSNAGHTPYPVADARVQPVASNAGHTPYPVSDSGVSPAIATSSTFGAGSFNRGGGGDAAAGLRALDRSVVLPGEADRAGEVHRRQEGDTNLEKLRTATSSSQYLFSGRRASGSAGTRRRLATPGVRPAVGGERSGSGSGSRSRRPGAARQVSDQ